MTRFTQAFRRAVEKNPQFKVAGSVNGDWAQDVAQRAVAGILPSLPEIAAVVTQGGDGYGAAQAFAAAKRPMPTIIMGNREDELRWWKEQKDANGYETMSVSIAPGVSTLAFWVAQQILDGKDVKKDLVVPFLRIDQDNLEENLANTRSRRRRQRRVLAGRCAEGNQRRDVGAELLAKGRHAADHQPVPVLVSRTPAGRRQQTWFDETGAEQAVVARLVASRCFGAVKALDGADLVMRSRRMRRTRRPQRRRQVHHRQRHQWRLSAACRGPSPMAATQAAGINARARANGVRCVFQELSSVPQSDDRRKHARSCTRDLAGWSLATAGGPDLAASSTRSSPVTGIDCQRTVGELSASPNGRWLRSRSPFVPSTQRRSSSSWTNRHPRSMLGLPGN
jgi:hypothetical protein